MAPSLDSKDKDQDKDKDPSTPPLSSNSSPPPSNFSSQSPPARNSSTPPPPNSSPPPPENSPPPPKATPPSPPPSSPPPSPRASPPPPYEASPPPPPPKDSPSPPPPSFKSSPPSPPIEEESPPKEDLPTPPPPYGPPFSSSSPSSSSNAPPSQQRPKDDDRQGSSSPQSPPPPPPPPTTSTSSTTSTSVSPPPPPPPPISSSSSSSPPPPTPRPPSSSPSPSSNSRTTSSGQLPKASESSGAHITEYSIVHSPGHPQDQAARIGIALGTVAAVLLIGFVLAIFFVRKRRRKLYNSMYMVPSAFASTTDSGSSFHVKPSPNGGGDYMHSSPDGIGNSKTWFTYEELASATDGFDSKNIIGAGGFGCVYKGFLQDGREVAIKKLKDNSGQGDREFRAEVEIISRVHHRHLVSLVGYCINDQQRLLVYEFVPNNTLYHHLHSPNKAPMNWALRVRVACGSARGIAYLHEDCHPRIIHRDIKSANILLANNWEAKVSDFGLAKLAQELESNTHVSTRVMGTFGYMAPEYATSGKLTEKSDVFSFGVVLLELITGRKPVDDSRPLGDESLVEWARPLMSEALESQNFDELADPRLEGNYDRGEMFRMIEAAAACVRHSASKRPRMSQVVRALDTMGDLSNGVKPGESEIIDSREQSVQIRMFKRMTFESQEYSSDNYTSQSSWASGNTHGAASGQAERSSESQT